MDIKNIQTALNQITSLLDTLPLQQGTVGETEKVMGVVRLMKQGLAGVWQEISQEGEAAPDPDPEAAKRRSARMAKSNGKDTEATAVA